MPLECGDSFEQQKTWKMITAAKDWRLISLNRGLRLILLLTSVVRVSIRAKRLINVRYCREDSVHLLVWTVSRKTRLHHWHTGASLLPDERKVLTREAAGIMPGALWSAAGPRFSARVQQRAVVSAH